MGGGSGRVRRCLRQGVPVGLGGVALCSLLVAALAFGGTGKLTPKDCISDDVTGADECAQRIDGLDAVQALAVSDDGRSVYATGFVDDVIVRFKRARNGKLTPKDCIQDEDSVVDTCPRQVKGLDGPNAVAISDDGKSVYVAGGFDDAIVRFKRNTRNGKLTPKDCIDDNDTGADDCAQETDGLDSPNAVVVSDDGKSVYVASFNDDAIVRFKRNTRTGKLTPRDCVEDDDGAPDDCAEEANGLNGVTSVGLSEDGKSVYAGSFFEDTILRLKRNRRNGKLTPKDCVEDNDTGVEDCAQEADGLEGVQALAVSDDGKSVYTVSSADSAIVRFKRNRRTGKLTPKDCVDDNDTGADDCAQETDGLDVAAAVAVSADGKSVYAGSFMDDAIVRFKRNRRNGKLTPKDCVDDKHTGADDCAQETDGLRSVQALTVSADGKSVYTASSGDDAVARLKRER